MALLLFTPFSLAEYWPAGYNLHGATGRSTLIDDQEPKGQGSVTIVPGMATLSIEEGAVASAASNVVTGRDLHETQTARASEVDYAPAPYFRLFEVDFNRLVDPPPKAHHWLPNVRAAWLGSLVLSATPMLSALFHQKPVSLSLVPDAYLYAFLITSVFWAGLSIFIHFGPDPRRELIKRIRKNFGRPTGSA